MDRNLRHNRPRKKEKSERTWNAEFNKLKQEFGQHSETQYKYCPNCGTVMEEQVVDFKWVTYTCPKCLKRIPE